MKPENRKYTTENRKYKIELEIEIDSYVDIGWLDDFKDTIKTEAEKVIQEGNKIVKAEFSDKMFPDGLGVVKLLSCKVVQTGRDSTRAEIGH